MKYCVISSALVAAHPDHRMDAAYWVPLMERAKKAGAAPGDISGVMKVAKTYEALYARPQRASNSPRLGDLVGRAENFDKA